MMDTNDHFLNGEVELTIIDPDPSVLLSRLSEMDPYRSIIQQSPLQDAALSLFTSLEENDILFIDSSHVAKTGSDVSDYLFRILPALAPSVLIHIHDIFFPFEWGNRSWNEAYLLRAVLQYGNAFKILFWNDFIYTR